MAPMDYVAPLLGPILAAVTKANGDYCDIRSIVGLPTDARREHQ
ncbi:hypothetical protein ABID59_000135 [Bradyrhizobium sp. S3.3.6]